MDLLKQLGFDNTFFVQIIVFALVFFLLSKLFFKPFLQLFELRHRRTVSDQEAAEKLMAQAEAKLAEYRDRLSEERAKSRKEYEAILETARKEEAKLLSHAREEAKRLTQEAAESVTKQRDLLRKQIEADVESLAQSISEKLLARKG